MEAAEARLVVRDELLQVPLYHHSAHLLTVPPPVLAPDGCIEHKRTQAVLQASGNASRNLFTSQA